jgi:hypothetical protein
MSKPMQRLSDWIAARRAESCPEEAVFLDDLERWNRQAGPVMTAQYYCEQFETWVNAYRAGAEEEGHTKAAEAFRDAWGVLNLAIRKSCLLDRLIYGGETLRKEKCPVHKGHWSGCMVNPCPICSHGICQTGWKKNPGDPDSANSGIFIVRTVGASEGG